MDDYYPFKGEDVQRITLQLVIESFATQQAIFTLLIEKLNISDSEKDEILAQVPDLVSKNKETLLKSLYEIFGKTPDV